MDKHSGFSRFLIGVVILLIISLLISSFIFSEPQYLLSAELITLILVLVVLALSESFNNLSIGKVISLSREVKKTESSNTALKSENDNLRAQIINVAANVNQSQVTYNGVSDSLLKALNVVPAGEREKEANDEIEKNNQESPATELESQSTRSDLSGASAVDKFWAARRGMPLTRFMRATELRVINRHVKMFGLEESLLKRNVKFTSAFEGLDPIMESQVYFDAHYNDNDKEVFFEVRNANLLRPDVSMSIYHALSKLYSYRKAKNKPAHLVLFLVKIPSHPKYEEERVNRVIDRLRGQFGPAIVNELLKVVEITVEEKEAERIIEGISSNEQRQSDA